MSGSTDAVVPQDRPITKQDIRAKLQDIAGEVDAAKEQAYGYRDYALMAGAAVIVGVIVVAYLMGKSKGKQRRTVVEIRRITA
jgi:hypothetical protein